MCSFALKQRNMFGCLLMSDFFIKQRGIQNSESCTKSSSGDSRGGQEGDKVSIATLESANSRQTSEPKSKYMCFYNKAIRESESYFIISVSFLLKQRIMSMYLRRNIQQLQHRCPSPLT